MSQIQNPAAITYAQAREHRRLSELLEDMLFALKLQKDAPPAAGMEAVLARRFMADVARLMAREPGGRALLRLPPGAEIPQADLRAALHDADIALAAFRRAHANPDEDETGWLMQDEDPEEVVF